MENKGSNDQESLFSLELVVDKLNLPNVVCRFPAIAFRLLDFPTLLIYHVEPDLSEVIRTKISSDPYYKLPHQLQELQDKKGNFPVKKGKSCLFKVPLNIIHTHLANTPLYVMIIDTYPNVPKLIGSCSIPLDDSMQLVYNDVEKLGLPVPSVHGERGEFTVYNLMGSEIGRIELGFRILSLGLGLIPHIPDNAVMKFQQKTINLEKPNEETKATETANIVLHDIQAADKPIQVNMYSETPKTEQQVQTVKEDLLTIATQTAEDKRRSANKFKKNKVSHDDDNFFVTNTTCPPPLYYNSESEPQAQFKPGLTFFDGRSHLTGASSQNNTFINGMTPVITRSGKFNDVSFEDDLYSECSDSTIRHEDKLSDSDINEYYEESYTQSKPLLRKTLHKSKFGESVFPNKNVSVVQDPNILGNVSQFPLINTLLDEILKLQRIGHPLETSNIKPKVAWEAHKLSRTSKQEEMKKEIADTVKDKREHPKISEHLAKGDAGYFEGKRICAAVPSSIPKNKSWLNKMAQKTEPEHSVKKTKLVSGMTNTQRLRLAKLNPKLLKDLEIKEQKRIAERNKNQVGTKIQPFNLGNPKTRANSQAFAEEVNQKPESLSIGIDNFEGALEMPTPRHRKPVPTPRKSLTNNTANLKVKEMVRARRDQLRRELALLDSPSEENLSEKESLADEVQYSDRSQKSINVYLPSAALNEEAKDDDATSVESLNFSERSKTALGKTRVISNPGFPRDSISRLSMVSNYTAQYSDDFEDDKYGNSYNDDKGLKNIPGQLSDHSSNSANEPSLRKIVDKYSSESGTDGEEPSLRKIVDHYSDDGEGDEPSLRKIVDKYSGESSEKTDTVSYHSARSRQSNHGEVSNEDLKFKTISMPNPTTSMQSPTPHHKLGFSNVTREALAASTPTAEDSETISDQDSVGSTARIPRSQIPSMSFETGTSLESTGGAAWKKRCPRPSPRRSLERIRTESVSSYAPSEDFENLSPLSPCEVEDVYSDTYDEDSTSTKKLKEQYAKDIKIPTSAKGLGYTWT